MLPSQRLKVLFVDSFLKLIQVRASVCPRQRRLQLERGSGQTAIGESRAFGMRWLRQNAGCRDSTGVQSALSGGQGLDGTPSRKKQTWVTVEADLQGEPCLSCRMAYLPGTDCRDRSWRAPLPALLMEWSFDDSGLFVTQETQRQLLSSGDGVSSYSQWYWKRQEPVREFAPKEGFLLTSRSFCSDLQISPEGPAGLALSPGPMSVKAGGNSLPVWKGLPQNPQLCTFGIFLSPPGQVAGLAYFLGWK